jgi:hypothetical protein
MEPQETQEATNSPDGPPAAWRSVLQAPATRRETLLFGLLILALVWATLGQRPRTVVVVPDTPARIGVMT